MEKPKILVIGSINMDLVTQTKIVPKTGETVLGTSFLTVPGGKGANQAIAAAKLGADVTMLGCIGDDAFGIELKQNLNKQGVTTKFIKTIPNESSGIASITLSEGDNSIIVVPGANNGLSPEMIMEQEHVIAEADIILLQLEVPLESVSISVELAQKHNVPVILNPAPIQELPKELLLAVTYITPNEHEQKSLLSNKELTMEEIDHLKQKCIVTQGEKGIYLYQDGLIPGYKVETIDSTGAGDTFNGALALSLSKGNALKEACHFANAAAALSVTKLGAQSGMPTFEEVELFLGENCS
ncbi:ribokinase [Metabacillus litoralis]|uniref:ribokinase n=1 Tax=Metabacillus litoralis TaxID=152268 RepID=UPI00203D7380|nr:ribokinase [Metabacillus litoralis]MCM3162326.1 ribokinase [Metabacillus litoralis]